MKKKIVLGIVCVLMVLLIGRLGYSYWLYQNLTSKYVVDGMEYEDNFYIYYGDDELYVLQLENWWNIWGGLEASSTMRQDENGNITEECYHFWVDLRFPWKEPEIELFMHYRDRSGDMKYITLYLNEYMQFSNPEEASNVQKQVLEDKKEWIKEIYQKVYDMWGVFDPNATPEVLEQRVE